MPTVVLVLPVLAPAGAERVVADLARRLSAHRFDVQVICLEDERALIGEELAAAGVHVVGLRANRRNTLLCARRLADQLPANRPLVLHAHLFHANLAARMAVGFLTARQRSGISVLGTVHVAERRFRPWQFWLDRLTADRCVAEVCVSRSVARYQRRKTRLPESFFPVIENGIDLRRFADVSRGVDVPGGGDSHVVSLGRLDPQKDYLTLLHAWSIVEREMPHARLTIAGRGPEEMRLRATASRLELQSVRFAGFVKDVPALLRTARLYVQSSAWEGFGLAVAEAMAVGLPSVVTAADSLPELVENGRSGRVVPVGQPGELARAILELLQDDASAAAMGVHARAEALRRFDVERMVADYATLYRRVLGSRAELPA